MGKIVGIFDERYSIGEDVGRILKTRGFKSFVVNNLVSWVRFSDFSKLDVAVVHTGFLLKTEDIEVESKDVLSRLPIDCCRVLTSGHNPEHYLKEMLTIGADYYCQKLVFNEDLIEVLRKGRLNEEVVAQRGLSFRDERGGVYYLGSEPSPERGVLNDSKYIEWAKRGERR